MTRQRNWIALGVILAAFVAVLMVSRPWEHRKEVATVTAGPPQPVLTTIKPQAPARVVTITAASTLISKPSTSRSFSSEELNAVHAFSPIWDDDTIKECGFDPTLKEAINAHVEDTYLMLVESFAAYSEVKAKDGVRTTLRVSLPEETVQQIRQYFVEGLGKIVGPEAIQKFTMPEHVENEFLGFGDMPTSLQIEQKPSAYKVSLSTSIMRRNAMIADSRWTMYEFPHQTMRAILPTLSHKVLGN